MTEFLRFVDDEKSIENKQNKKWKILIVEDDKDVHKITKLVLKDIVMDGRGVEILSAYSKREAMEILSKTSDIALAIIDVVMEDKTAGLDLIKFIREDLKNHMIRLIIRTGQPGYAPRRDVILNYDINDYREKTEISTEMMVGVVITALRSYRDIIISEKEKMLMESLINIYSNSSHYGSINNIIIEAVKKANDVLSEILELSAVVVNELGDISRFGCNPPVNIEFRDTENEVEWVEDNLVQISFKERDKVIVKALIRIDGILNDRWKKIVEIYFLQLFNLIRNIALEDLFSRSMYQMIFTLADLIEHRSVETGEHIRRVGEITKILAKSIGFDEEYSNVLRLASMLHDVGKIGISDSILNKPGKLTEKEFEIMKTHTTIGYKILSKYDDNIFKIASLIALHHHENWDGSGYPEKLRGEEIPLEARIVSIVDTYDALLSDRVYRPAWPEEKALNYIKTMVGVKFDPNIAEKFFENYHIIKNFYSSNAKIFKRRPKS